MIDLIDRQAAIDALITLWLNKPFGNPALTEIRECVERVPSAQPKIIRCKECKWWDEKPLAITRRCSIFNTDTDMTFFCKHGRRENE